MASKLASLPTCKFHYARKDCQSGLGIRLSSHWKAPKISTVLTSPSGNRISLLLQGAESSHPHVLPVPAALSPSGNWIPNPHRHTQSQCLHPADSLTPGLSRKHWVVQSNVSFRIIPPQLESVSSYSPWDPNGAILCSEFYFQRYVGAIGIAFRIIFTNCRCKAPLLSLAACRMQGPLYGWKIVVTCPELHRKLQKGETGSLEVAVFSPWTLVCVSEGHFVDLNLQEYKTCSKNRSDTSNNKWALNTFLSSGCSNLHTV